FDGQKPETSSAPIGLGVQRQIQNGYVIARVMELVWVVFIHNNQGVFFPGLHGFLCWVTLMMLSAFGRSQELLAFTMAWTVLVILRRIHARKLWKAGVRHFSSYTGSPYIMWTFLPKLSEIQARNLEPVICMGISYVVLGYHQAFGALLMVSALCMGGVRIY